MIKVSTGGDMGFNYEAAGQEFLSKIEGGKFPVELLENEGLDHREREEKELTAFNEYLESEDCNSFKAEVFKE